MKDGETMSSIQIVSEEYIDGAPVKDTYSFSGEDASAIIDMLYCDDLVFSDDLLKTEPEKSYTVVINEKERYQINREANEHSMYYMFRNNAGSITGTWVSEEVITLIEEAISTQ